MKLISLLFILLSVAIPVQSSGFCIDVSTAHMIEYGIYAPSTNQTGIDTLATMPNTSVGVSGAITHEPLTFKMYGKSAFIGQLDVVYSEWLKTWYIRANDANMNLCGIYAVEIHDIHDAIDALKGV